MYKPEQIAAYILNSTGSITTMKLQKLVYYAQALSLVKNNKPLFEEDFQAWANGPVCKPLFDQHKRQFFIYEGFFGDTPCLNDPDKVIVDTVIDKLDVYSGADLSAITHREQPWLDARIGLNPADRGRVIITKETIRDYYSKPNSNPLFN